ncbi:uncharacterized protein EKO05_0002937 [Ascochyta rabiei]|nr:uncharacterized protein EKO05_0002937 [Ascochyta rabiei]UPX12388.1 hypothetical protein EKO05_0002937 [Ascochyta rabiei]
MAVKDKRHAFEKWKKPGKKSKPGDGRYIELTSMRAATALTPADDGEARPPLPPTPSLPPPPPSPHRTAFAELMNEVRADAKDAPKVQTSNESKTLPQGKATSQPKHAGRKPQAPTQPVADGRTNDKQDELDKRGEGIGGAGNTLTTAVSLCKKQHAGLVCHWSDSDPINRKGNWRLEKFDYQENTAIFNNGVEDHKQCVPSKPIDLVSELAARVVQEFERRQHKKSPLFDRVFRVLSELYVQLMGDMDGHNEKGKKSKDESSEKGEKGAKTVGRTANPARREAEVSRLRKLMEEQAQSRAADQKRRERKAIEQTQAQRAAQGTSALDALSNTRVDLDTSKRGGRRPEEYDRSSKLQTKSDLAMTQANKSKHEKEPKAKCGKSNQKKAVAKPHLTEAEREALRRIKAAQKQEAKKSEQAEREVEKRMLRLAADEERAGGMIEEDETDDALADTIEEALQDLFPQTLPSNKRPLKPTQKNSTRTMRPAIESATNGPDDRISPPPAKKQKRVTKGRARPVIEDSSEESDNVNAPKASTKADEMEKPKEMPRAKVSLANYLKAKTAATADAKIVDQTERADTKHIKTHKSKAFITDSDLEDDEVSNVQLLTDKLNGKVVSVETTSTGKVTTTTEQDGNIVEEVIETTTVAVRAGQEDGSTNRTEVTETTVVTSDSSEQGDITVEHATRAQAVSVLTVPEQELSRDSPPPSPERKLQVDFDAFMNAQGIDFTISAPSNPNTLAADVTPSPHKRKLEVDSRHQEPPPSPKKT